MYRGMVFGKNEYTRRRIYLGPDGSGKLRRVWKGPDGSGKVRTGLKLATNMFVVRTWLPVYTVCTYQTIGAHGAHIDVQELTGTNRSC